MNPAGMKLPGMNVVVLGLARQGVSAARALLDGGAQVRVLDRADDATVRDRAVALSGAAVVLGREEPTDVVDTELIVASAGVPPASPWIRAAVERGIPVWSDLELAHRLGANIVAGVTGTNGKTTTTEMMVEAMRAAGRDVTAGGNIGIGLTEHLDGREIVAELSSFQLARIEAFRAPVAIVLNIASDHLDWHGSAEEYAAAKARIVENQTDDDTVIYHDDEACAKAVAHAHSRRLAFSVDRVPAGGAGVEDGWIVVPQGRVVEVSRMRAKGRPNLADAIAAAAGACALGCDPAPVGEALAAYAPKPHRIEPLATIDGVRYVNDSKATDPHATLAALEELDHVVLIAGGRNRDRAGSDRFAHKGLDLGELASAAPKLRAVIAIGEATEEIEEAFADTGVDIERAGSMADAVTRAAARARAGDTVLLSPACASFDMFANYEARGEAFRAEVMRRQGSTT